MGIGSPGRVRTPDLGRSGSVGYGEVEHGLGGIGGNHPEPGIDQVGSEQSAPAADLDDQAVALSHRLEQPEDAWRAGVGVEPETEMVDECQVVPVVGHVLLRARTHDSKYRKPHVSAGRRAALDPAQPGQAARDRPGLGYRAVHGEGRASGIGTSRTPKRPDSNPVGHYGGMDSRKALVALALAEGVARSDHSADALIVAGFDSHEEAALAHAYLVGFVIQLLAEERNEGVRATAAYVRRLLDQPFEDPSGAVVRRAKPLPVRFPRGVCRRPLSDPRT